MTSEIRIAGISIQFQIFIEHIERFCETLFQFNFICNVNSITYSNINNLPHKVLLISLFLLRQPKIKIENSSLPLYVAMCLPKIPTMRTHRIWTAQLRETAELNNTRPIHQINNKVAYWNRLPIPAIEQNASQPRCNQEPTSTTSNDVKIIFPIHIHANNIQWIGFYWIPHEYWVVAPLSTPVATSRQHTFSFFFRHFWYLLVCFACDGITFVLT